MMRPKPRLHHCLRLNEDIIIVAGKCQVQPKQGFCDGCICHNLLKGRFKP